MVHTAQINTLLTEREVGNKLHLSVQWLRRRRRLGLPPAALKLGGAVRYSPMAVDDFLRTATCKPRSNA